MGLLKTGSLLAVNLMCASHKHTKKRGHSQYTYSPLVEEEQDPPRSMDMVSDTLLKDPVQCTSEDELPGEIVTGINKTFLGGVTFKLKLNVEVTHPCSGVTRN